LHPPPHQRPRAVAELAAELVLDGFGEPDAPARVLADRVDSGCDGVLDLDVLARVVARGRAGD
jgi:hypothetical protein